MEGSITNSSFSYYALIKNYYLTAVSVLRDHKKHRKYTKLSHNILKIITLSNNTEDCQPEYD